MKKIFTLCAAVFCAISTFATEGALNGKFTINSDGDQVVFSKGNLQYVGTWQFATNQWDYFGDSQADNHRDLFGWGTGDAPNQVSKTYEDYYTFTDWGVNPITNGGNEANLWRTLTYEEWYYLFYTRENAATLFALGSVNGVNGTIFLPDNWILPANVTFVASAIQQGIEDYGCMYFNPNADNFSHNTYTAEQWEVMESAGAVFLPAAGYRGGSEVGSVGTYGDYWSATPYGSTDAKDFCFSSTDIGMPEPIYLYSGISVRLVQAAPSGPTGCANVQSDDVQCTKVLRNGQLYLKYKGTMYTVHGTQVK